MGHERGHYIEEVVDELDLVVHGERALGEVTQEPDR